MDSSATVLRRSSRAAAAAAMTRLRASAAGGDAGRPAEAPAVPPTVKPAQAMQQRKRRRTAKNSEAAPVTAEPVPLPAAAAAPPPAAEEEGGGLQAQARRRGGAKKAAAAGAKAAAAATAVPAGPSREYEEEMWAQGYANVAGVDEAGRGPLAGPVVAAACVIPPGITVPGIDDSKKLSETQREEIYEALTSHPGVRWAVQVIEAEEIDRINILQAALKAMEGAAAGLGQGGADFLLVDGNRLPKAFDPARSRAIVKGDAKCYAIAAASIIAKVTRDRLMDGYHSQFPLYNFEKHKGYCVPAHVEAIRQHGPCAIHRRTFAPIKHWYPAGQEAAQGE